MLADETIRRLQLLSENPDIVKWEDDVTALKMAILALEALRKLDAILSAWHSVL